MQMAALKKYSVATVLIWTKVFFFFRLITTNKRRSTTNTNTSTRGCSHRNFYNAITVLIKQSGPKGLIITNTNKFLLPKWFVLIFFFNEKSWNVLQFTIHTKLYNKSQNCPVIFFTKFYCTVIVFLKFPFDSSKKKKNQNAIIRYRNEFNRQRFCFLFFFNYISSHLSLATRPGVLPPTCKLTFRDFSKFNNSWNSCFTLWLVFADVSMKLIPQFAAWVCPSDILT